VIASLWKVDDDATAELMSKFYARLQRGEKPAAALQGAQSEMASDPQFSAPLYWAAFILQGEYR
jgi:CHAT domain-containing protein